MFKIMNNTMYILKKELREVFPDKQSLAMMLIIPFMIPLMLIGLSFLFDVKTDINISDYNKIGIAYELSEIENKLLAEMNFEIINQSEKELNDKFLKEDIYLYLTKKDNNYIINYDPSNEYSSYAASYVEQYLNQYKLFLQSQLLASENVNSEEIFNVLKITENVLEKNSFYTSYMLNFAFLFIIMAIVISATYPATDATAGEKERGTLETLLTLPIKSRDIILGKLLSVTISSIITGILSLLLALISFRFANNKFSIYENSPLVLSFDATILSIFVIIFLALFVSGLCIAIASLSKSFKEAQSALTPLTFICFFPGMISFMIGFKTNAFYAIIPFLNYSMIFTDISNGIINIFHIILMFISTIIYIIIVIFIITKQYKSEKILFSN